MKKEGLGRARLPLVLLGILVVVFIATGYAPPAGRLNWFLEVLPAFIGILVLIVTYSRFPMSDLVYWLVFVHTLILVYGGYYTYAKTPLGDWVKDIFGLARNHYDRVGHLALGFFPAFRANVTRREHFGIAVLANFTHQGIALFL